MTTKAERERARAEKNRAKALEYERLAKAAEKSAAESERDDDTLRKILDGAHMQTEAITNPDIAALLQKHRNNLWRDRDRDAFGMPRLTEEEKIARGIAIVAKRGRKSKSEADAIMSMGFSSTQHARQDKRETEDA